MEFRLLEQTDGTDAFAPAALRDECSRRNAVFNGERRQFGFFGANRRKTEDQNRQPF